MSKINTLTPIFEVDGKEMFEYEQQTVPIGAQMTLQTVKTDRPVTFRSICVNILMQADETVKDGKEKLERFLLGKRILKKEIIELKSEEKAKIKSIMAKSSYSSLIYGQIEEILETGKNSYADPDPESSEKKIESPESQAQ